MSVEITGRSYAWLDTGIRESSLEASQFIATLENLQGFEVACPEEIAFRQGWIAPEVLQKLAVPLTQSGFGLYLQRLLTQTVHR